MNKENNDIINKFLLIGDKFMPEMHLWDPKVQKYSACGPFRLDAACFQHDSAYAKYKDRLNRRQSDIVSKNKALKIDTDSRVNGYQRGLASIVYKFLNGRIKESGINLQANFLNNEILAEELHKPITKNF